MKIRCFCVTDRAYASYGARGITMCARWRQSFQAFLDDMGKKTSREHSIDRRDNDGHYSCGRCEECLANGWPANCRWATDSVQQRNRRGRPWFRLDGAHVESADLALAFGIAPRTFRGRLKKHGLFCALLVPPATKLAGCP